MHNKRVGGMQKPHALGYILKDRENAVPIDQDGYVVKYVVLQSSVSYQIGLTYGSKYSPMNHTPCTPSRASGHVAFASRRLG